MASYGGGYPSGGGGYGGPGGYDAGPTMAGGFNQAQQYASNAYDRVGQFAEGPDGLGGQFMKGPQGVQMLAFGGGCAGVFIGGLNIFRIFGTDSIGFVEWIIAFYQIFFGLIMITLEIQGEWVAKYPKAKEMQATLVEYCRFLTILGGRGAFYFFVGSLTIGNGFSDPVEVDEILVGVYIFFIGGLCIAMQLNPQVAQPQANPGGYADPRHGGY